MNVFAKIVQVVTILPMLVKMVENLFKNGTEKRSAVVSAIKDALGWTEMLLGKEIVDEEKAAEAIGEMTDAVVKFLNATIWNKNRK